MGQRPYIDMTNGEARIRQPFTVVSSLLKIAPSCVHGRFACTDGGFRVNFNGVVLSPAFRLQRCSENRIRLVDVSGFSL